jgi:sugar lactone lactonase YvrE
MRPLKLRIQAVSLIATSLVLLAGACASDDEAGPDGSPEPDGTPEAPSTVVAFDFDAREFIEGVAVDADGNVFASVTPQGRLVRIAPGSSEAEDFGKIEGLRQDDFGLLGLTVDADGNVYGAVVSENSDANGVWRFDAESGDPERLPGTEKISFPNAVIVDGDTIYITDTTGSDGKGAVWRVPEDGDAEVWAQDAQLAGDGSAGFGFPLGPNGIDVYNDTVYVGLTEPAKIAAIPIADDGSAGEVTIFADLTKSAPNAKPAAVDGIDIDDDGNVYVAAPIIHTVLKVSSDGEDVSTVADAEDNLDGPASVAIGEDAVYVANFSGALGESSNKKGPSIVRVPI